DVAHSASAAPTNTVTRDRPSAASDMVAICVLSPSSAMKIEPKVERSSFQSMWSPSTRDGQHSGPADAVALERHEGFVGGGEVEDLRVRADGQPGRLLEEGAAVVARVVGHAADHALLVEAVVLEGWDGAHVDPAQHHHAAAVGRLQRRRHELARR